MEYAIAEETTSKVEPTVREIRRRTRKQYSAEEKVRIVLEGLRGEEKIAKLYRREGIHQNMYYKWSKEFLEAGKQRLVGDTRREADSQEVEAMRSENEQFKAVVAELTLNNRTQHTAEALHMRLPQSTLVISSEYYVEIWDQILHEMEAKGDEYCDAALAGRMIFFMNIPIGTNSVFLDSRFLLDHQVERKPRFDPLGLITAVIGFCSILYAANIAENNGWTGSTTLLAFGVGIVALVLHALIELYFVKESMTSLQLFGGPVCLNTTLLGCGDDCAVQRRVPHASQLASLPR